MIWWQRNRPPKAFKNLDRKTITALMAWIARIPPAPVAIEGETAEHAGERDAPSFVGNRADAEAWLAEEIAALLAIGESRVVENREGDGPGETVDYEVQCTLDAESNAAQLTLHLHARDPSIGDIVMLCEMARLPDDRYIAWGSGLEHPGELRSDLK